MVDKPAFLSLAAAEQLLELADKQGRCLAEATVFGYHPQIAAMQAAFAEADDAPIRLSVLQSFPLSGADMRSCATPTI